MYYRKLQDAANKQMKVRLDWRIDNPPPLFSCAGENMKQKIFFYYLVIFGFSLLLASCVVPSPSEENTTVVEGTLIRVSTCCDGGDVQFWLAEYEQGFYLNRAIEAGFDLDAFQTEVAIGDTVYITAFNGWLPDDPEEAGPSLTPSAEIRTADQVYFSRMPTTP